MRNIVETIATAGMSGAATFGRSGASNETSAAKGCGGLIGTAFAAPLAASRYYTRRIMTTTTEKSYTARLDKAICPTCAQTDVRRSTNTSELVYLCCQACGYTWPIPERRKRPAAQTPSGADHDG